MLDPSIQHLIAAKWASQTGFGELLWGEGLYEVKEGALSRKGPLRSWERVDFRGGGLHGSGLPENTSYPFGRQHHPNTSRSGCQRAKRERPQHEAWFPHGEPCRGSWEVPTSVSTNQRASTWSPLPTEEGTRVTLIGVSHRHLGQGRTF